MFAGILTFDELTTANPLGNLFGGGYEVGLFEGTRFRKMDDVTYLFWRVGRNENGFGVALTPTVVLRMSYVNDLLVIRTLETEMVSAEIFKIARDDMHVVGPVYRDVGQTEIEEMARPKLDSTWLCNFFAVDRGDGNPEILFRLHADPVERPWIRFEENEGSIRIGTNKGFLAETARELEAGM